MGFPGKTGAEASRFLEIRLVNLHYRSHKCVQLFSSTLTKIGPDFPYPGMASTLPGGGKKVSVGILPPDTFPSVYLLLSAVSSKTANGHSDSFRRCLSCPKHSGSKHCVWHKREGKERLDG